MISRPSLNSAQQEAVETSSGPLLVLAGAGTGKTRVITYRIARLIQKGTRPSRILGVTFTNKAAREMLERCLELLPKRSDDVPEISTFHALCLRILRRHIRKLGFPSRFAIYDRGDQESIARSALRELRVGNDRVKPGALLARIREWKARGLGANEASVDADEDPVVAHAYVRYQEALKLAGALDFDDLLMMTETLFRDHPEALRAEANRFDHILVDEYQDTNGIQYRIVKQLAEGHQNLCVVGDDDQSIYGWRGAEVRHILDFPDDWNSTKTVRLEENYRSAAPILALANRLIARNGERHEKVLRPTIPSGSKPRFAMMADEAAEAKAVVRDIESRLREKGISPKDFAILVRTNEQPRLFEQELRGARIPYIVVGGMSFFDRREVRDVLAYLKFLSNSQDEVSLLRIINTPPRGIGKTAVQKLLDHAVRTGVPLWEVLGGDLESAGLNAIAAGKVSEFHKTMKRFQEASEGSRPADLARKLVEEVGYRAEITRLFPSSQDQESRWRGVEELLDGIALHQRRKGRKASLATFLDEVALAEWDDQKKEDKGRDAVTLMTLHSAKGLEFPEVYLVGMEEGILPHERSLKEGRNLEEERRLCYVGITRARERLTITVAGTRVKWGRTRETEPSRFLFEMEDLSQHPKLGAFTRSSGRGKGKGRRLQQSRAAGRRR